MQIKEQGSTQKVVGKIDGQPIYAPQLGRTNGEWQNGYGTPSDGQDTNNKNQPVRKLTKDAKQLIIYFSRSGSTELLAGMIEEKTSADILEVVVKNPYPGVYQKTLERANLERENNNYPELNMQLPNLSQYDTIFLGYQIWAMHLSHPMNSFLTTFGQLLSGKRIAPFMSEGGYGQGDSVQQIQEILREQGASQNTFTQALVVDGNKVDRSKLQVTQWIAKINK